MTAGRWLWVSERRLMVLRLALSQLAMTTDTGQERADIAEIPADLAEIPATGPGPVSPG